MKWQDVDNSRDTSRKAHYLVPNIKLGDDTVTFAMFALNSNESKSTSVGKSILPSSKVSLKPKLSDCKERGSSKAIPKPTSKFPVIKSDHLILKSDLLDLFIAVGERKLNEKTIEIDERSATTVMLVSGGYPEKYAKGAVITFDFPNI